jgi:Bardet-Biedl syndrome 5 protein
MSGTDLQIWQDREIRFDCPFSQITTRRGELEIDSIHSVEDTKGNNGEKGSLSCTNLRIIWCCHANPKTNLSIGLNCIASVSIKNANSRLRGNTQACHLMTRYNNARFEFVFTSLVKNSPRLFTTIQSIHKSYETTRLYRDLKLRGAIIRDASLILLPQEDIYTRLDGVWNLSSDQGNLGILFVTNVRLVWHAQLAENFNVSIPYLQIKLIKVRDSKFGHALVIETSARSGGYVLGFRIDPLEKLQSAAKEIQTLHTVYSSAPNFGVQYTISQDLQQQSQSSNPNSPDHKSTQAALRAMDDIEITDNEADKRDVLTQYMAENSSHQQLVDEKGKPVPRPIVYNETLGLAIEALRDGVTLEELWQVQV